MTIVPPANCISRGVSTTGVWPPPGLILWDPARQGQWKPWKRQDLPCKGLSRMEQPQIQAVQRTLREIMTSRSSQVSTDLP